MHSRSHTYTQVKRLTMGLLRSTEDSRPLVHNNACSPTSGSTHTISDGYVNEAICDADLKLISAKFGDSCRKSLTSVMDKTSSLGVSTLGISGGGGGIGGSSVGTHDGCEFDFKKNFLRETSSGKFESIHSFRCADPVHRHYTDYNVTQQ